MKNKIELRPIDGDRLFSITDVTDVKQDETGYFTSYKSREILRVMANGDVFCEGEFIINNKRFCEVLEAAVSSGKKPFPKPLTMN